MALTSEQLSELKSRMILAARVCKQMVATGRNQFFDEETYPLIYAAFARLEDDVTAVLAELDVYREMFTGRVEDFVNESSNAARPVAEAPTPDDVGASEDSKDDAAAAGVGVQEGGANKRRRSKRSQRRGNKGASGKDSS